jgi:deoxyadenosine/deoxycytidine kinase
MKTLSPYNYYFVEGAAGVGKTTLVKILEQNLPVEAIYEPVESFINVNGTGDILQLYETNPERWALTANIYMTLMHVKSIAHYQPRKHTIIIVDRSMYADYLVFMAADRAQNNIIPLEWEIYHTFFTMIAQYNIRPSGFIYLQADPVIACKRMHTRARPEEKKDTLPFCKHLDYFYKQWFIEKRNVPEAIASVPTLFIDAHYNFKDDITAQNTVIAQVKTFIARS